MVAQRIIPIDRIDRDPDQPRKTFDESDLAELVASIASLGLLQSVTVRYSRSSRRYTLVDGERRWRAAQRLGLTELPAMILGELDDEDAFVRSIAGNLNRADVAPMEEAAAFARLVAAGWDTARIGSTFGKTETYIRYRVDLLGLVPAAREVVDKGQLPVGLAWYVCRLGADHQHTFLAKWARGEFPSFRDAEAYAQACREATGSTRDGFFLIAEEPDDARREQIRAGARRIVTDLERLERAWSAANTLQATHTDDLAAYLSATPCGIGVYRARVDALASAVTRLQSNLRKAAAAGAVVAELNPDVLVS